MINNSLHSVPILTFHKVDPSFEWGVTRITPHQFQRILNFLKNQGYQSITLRQLTHPTQKLPPKPIVITFDDSYESIYSYAFPLMETFGFTGTIFVVAGYVGKLNIWDVNLGWKTFRHLSWEQICRLKTYGFEIGSHTVSHIDLTRCDEKQVEMELLISKKRIEDKIGDEVLFISYPYGRYNKCVVDACKKYGYRNGCGYWISKNDKKLKETFVFKRKAYYLFDCIWNLKAKLGTNVFTSIEEIKLRIVNLCSHGSTMIKQVKRGLYN